MSQPHFRRALFVRLDRIGDLVLSLPLDAAGLADQVDWWIPQGLSFITESAVPTRSALEFSKSVSFGDVIRLARLVRKNRYDLAVIFHAPWWAGFIVWLAGVPVRVGVRSQWHSFLFFNRGVRQKRSRAELSELEYNFRLVENGLRLEAGSLVRSTLALRSKSGRPSLAPAGDFYVVHPGMSGSALNWPADRYAALILTLSTEIPVVITGTASDEDFLAPLRLALSSLPTSRVVWLDGKLSGPELIGLLQNARAVVAPSTGVVHLAASVGVPTVGLYSNVLVQRAVRWGPQGARVAVVEPPMDCISATCMEQIAVADVLAALRGLLARH